MGQADKETITENSGVKFIEGDTNREPWHNCTKDMVKLPERSERCLACFNLRLLKTAQLAKDLNIKVFTTTLSSSRWKSFEQICLAGAGDGRYLRRGLCKIRCCGCKSKEK